MPLTGDRFPVSNEFSKKERAGLLTQHRESVRVGRQPDEYGVHAFALGARLDTYGKQQEEIRADRGGL